MKTLNSFRAFAFFIILVLFRPESGKSMIVFFNYANFKNTDTTSFTEFYLKTITTIKLVKNQKGLYEASINMVYRIILKDSTVFLKSYNLSSPGLNDTFNLNYALIDLKRIILKQNNYRFEAEITDNNNPSDKNMINMLIDNHYKKELLSSSDIELADTIFHSDSTGVFSRNSFTVIPNVFNAYSTKHKSLFFYSEIYNTGKIINDQYFFIKYYLAGENSNYPEREKFVKLSPDKIIPLNGTLNIEGLPTGNYDIVIEIINIKNKTLFTKTTHITIQKEDEILLNALGFDSKTLLKNLFDSYSLNMLKSCLDYIYFISDKNEIEESKELATINDSVRIKEFLYLFCIKNYTENPAQQWINFLGKIEQCNKMFSTPLRKGYLTDMGRVYLDYGPPNHIVEASIPDIAYPYQIWQYFHLSPTQHYKKFVFFNYTGALNEFTLIYSDANGEPQNPNWKDIIRKYNKGSKFGAYGDYLDMDFNE